MAMRRYLLLSPPSLLLLALLVPRAGGTQLFVSPIGHDVSGDGSVDNPYRRMQAAIDNAFDYDVIILTAGVHTSDNDVLFANKKLTVRGQSGPITREGGCWPVHTADVRTPTLTRCNVTSWPQTWTMPNISDVDALDTMATSVQEWPASYRDDGRDTRGFHGATMRPIPSSVDGDFADPGDSPRGNPDDWTCGRLGCLPGFHGAGILQGSVHSNTTIVGARFVFLDGDEAIIRDLHIRGAYESQMVQEAQEGGCLYVSGDAAVTVVDSVFSFCRSSVGGGAVALGFKSHVWFHGVRFLNNTSQRGGAVLTLMPGDFHFDLCEFSGNSADQGGSVFTTDISSPSFYSCDFYGSSAVRGGVLAADGQSTPSFFDCAFVKNAADDGGVCLAQQDARPAFSNSTFQNNTAQKRGGIVFAEGSSVTLINASAVYFNRAGVAAAYYSTSFKSLVTQETVFGYNTAIQGPKDVFPESLHLSTLGVASNNTACSGRGERTVQDTWRCNCVAPFRGEECEITCPGFNETTGEVCSGHGVCDTFTSDHDTECVWYGGRRWMCLPVARATCRCQFGYGGRQCASQCPGMLRKDMPGGLSHQVCSGHGSCVLNNGSLACACEFGWGGADCSEIRLYAVGSGGTASHPRIVRLGDLVLVNNADPGLHVLAIKRSTLAVVWNRVYEVNARDTESSVFASGLDNDGTVNVQQRASEDGTSSNQDQEQQGPQLQNPQDEGRRYFGEEAANEMSRDLSLLDSRHLVVVTSAGAWEPGTNMALDQALQRCGAPSLASYLDAKNGSGRAFALIGTPDMGRANGTYMVGPLNPTEFANRSFVEIQVNLRQQVEEINVRWCGSRVYNAKGVDVSHLNGTVCKEVAMNAQEVSVLPENVSNATNATANATACQTAKFKEAVNQFQLPYLAENGSFPLNSSLTDLNETNSSIACNDTANVTEDSQTETVSMTLRWEAFGRAGADQGEATGLRLEVWDLDADVDATSGMLPEERSQLTKNQACCNRSAHWDHGTCGKGRTVVQDTVLPWVLRCVETGWMADHEGHIFGSAVFAGSAHGTLRRNSPIIDLQSHAGHWGHFTLYDQPLWERDHPFTDDDISLASKSVLSGSREMDYYADSPFPTPDPRFIS